MFTDDFLSLHCSVCSIDLKIRGLWFESTVWPMCFPRINNINCDRIHSSLTTVHCFNNCYVGKQPLTWKEYFEYFVRLKELQQSIDRCTGLRDISEIMLKTALNTIQSIFAIISVPSIY